MPNIFDYILLSSLLGFICLSFDYSYIPHVRSPQIARLMTLVTHKFVKKFRSASVKVLSTRSS